MVHPVDNCDSCPVAREGTGQLSAKDVCERYTDTTNEDKRNHRMDPREKITCCRYQAVTVTDLARGGRAQRQSDKFSDTRDKDRRQLATL